MRWAGRHDRTTAGLLFGVFILVYLWPVLVGGDILSPRSLLFTLPPWASSAPPEFLAHSNLLLSDVSLAQYPWNVLARDFIHAGTFPAWSQHAYAGVPFFANPQTALLTPFSLPLWILPLDYGIGLAAALKLLVAALGMYLLVRELRLGFWPAVLAGVSFSLCSFNVVWLGHETLVSVAAMLPWAVWLVERTLRDGRLGAPLGLVLVTTLILTGGHPGTGVHVMVATGLYAVVRGVSVSDLRTRERLRRFGLVVGALLGGTLLVAPLLLPAFEAGIGTIGLHVRSQAPDASSGALLPFGVVRTVLFPDWWGRPSAESFAGPLNYNERTFYAGGVAVVLALVALVSAGGWRRKAPFAALALVGIGGPLRAPLLGWFATEVPIMRQAQHQRMLLLFEFGLVVLAAFGLQRLIEAPRERVRALAVVAVGLLVGLLALATASIDGGDLSQAAGNVLHLRHATGTLVEGAVQDSGSIIATSVGWWLVVVVVLGLLLVLMWRAPRRTLAVAGAIVGLAALDLQYFAHGYQPMQPADRITPPRTEAIAFLQAHANGSRFVGVGNALPNDWGALYGLRDARGYDPPQPSMRWSRLWQIVYPDQIQGLQTMLAAPDASGLNVLSVLGVRYIVTAPDVAPEAMPESLSVAYQGQDATVFANPGAVPRAMVARHVVSVAGEPAARAAIAEAGFEPRSDVVVERDERAAAALAAGGDGSGRAAVAHETDTSVTLDATLARRGLVVLDDALARGWSVRVDGRAADAVRVDSVMRGVVVGAGRHQIVWSYRVPGLRLGLLLSGLAGAALAVACAAAWRRRRTGATRPV